jgi:hypothetical protein
MPRDVGDAGPAFRVARYGLAIGVGLASTVVFVLLSLRGVNLPDLAHRLEHTDWFPWVPLALASYVAGHVLRGVRCKLLVSREAKLSVVEATNPSSWATPPTISCQRGSGKSREPACWPIAAVCRFSRRCP